LNNKEKLNEFFVSCFYSILDAEERALESIERGKLSLKEIHVIEAVFKTKKTNENNFSTIAKLLGVTLGTLTASFIKLEKKGYLFKEQNKNDKRVYSMEPTRIAELANDEHAAFHQKMINGITKTITEKELENLVGALDALDNFFKDL
jgi:DNA-binding MarR family transcriptional regulator